MIHLHYIPAIGCETSKCNAIEYRATIYYNYAEKNGGKMIPLDQRKGLAAVSSMTSTLSKILGYFPVIGTIIGLIRIYDTYTDSMGLLTNNKFQHIARGVVELLSLGFLLLVPDLIKSFNK